MTRKSLLQQRNFLYFHFAINVFLQNSYWLKVCISNFAHMSNKQIASLAARILKDS